MDSLIDSFIDSFICHVWSADNNFPCSADNNLAWSADNNSPWSAENNFAWIVHIYGSISRQRLRELEFTDADKVFIVKRNGY